MIKYSRYATSDIRKQLMHMMCGEGHMNSSMADDMRTEGTHRDSLCFFIIHQRV